MGTNESGYPAGEGWVAFAGVMLMLAGFLNFVWGNRGDRQLGVLHR